MGAVTSQDGGEGHVGAGGTDAAGSDAAEIDVPQTEQNRASVAASGAPHWWQKRLLVLVMNSSPR